MGAWGIFGMARRTKAESDPEAGVSYSYAFSLPSSKEHIDEHKALQCAAVFRCVSIIAQAVSVLPWRLYDATDQGRVMLSGEPLDRLLHVQANEEMSALDLRLTMQAHALLWGNAYAEIERARDGEVIALWPIEPHRVQVKRDLTTRRLYYEVTNDQTNPIQLQPDRVFHLKGLGYDGVTGYSPVRLAREAIASSLAMEKYGGSYFGNSAIPSGYLTADKPLSEEQQARLTEQWNKNYRGSRNAQKTAMLFGGLAYKTISNTPEDSQFSESRKFQVEEIARWYGVPPHKLADLSRATYSNIEHQAKEFVDDAIHPWVSRWEAEAQMKLVPRDQPSWFTRINMNALLRGDSKARSEFYKNLFSVGAMSPNEIREKEDMNSMGEIGDVRMVPANHISLDRARDYMPRNAANTTKEADNE